MPSTCRFCVFAGGLLVALTFTVLTGCQPSKEAVHLEKGEMALGAGDFAQAEQHFSEVLGNSPRSALAHLGRGKALEGQGSLTKAADDYELALKLDVNLHEARERLVRVLVDLGDGRQALARLADMPGEPSSDLLLLRGRAYLQTGQAQEAKADFQKILDNNSDMAFARFHLGEAHAKLGKLQLAEKDYSDVLKLDATDFLLARAYWGRSQVRSRLGHKETAEEDRQAAANLDPRLTFVDSAMGKNMLETITGRSGDEVRLDPLTK